MNLYAKKLTQLFVSGLTVSSIAMTAHASLLLKAAKEKYLPSFTEHAEGAFGSVKEYNDGSWTIISGSSLDPKTGAAKTQLLEVDRYYHGVYGARNLEAQLPVPRIVADGGADPSRVASVTTDLKVSISGSPGSRNLGQTSGREMAEKRIIEIDRDGFHRIYEVRQKVETPIREEGEAAQFKESSLDGPGVSMQVKTENRGPIQPKKAKLTVRNNYRTGFWRDFEFDYSEPHIAQFLQAHPGTTLSASYVTPGRNLIVVLRKPDGITQEFAYNMDREGGFNNVEGIKFLYSVPRGLQAAAKYENASGRELLSPSGNVKGLGTAPAVK